MELDNSQKGLLPGYLASFDGLIGDERTGVAFRETVKGIIGVAVWRTVWEQNEHVICRVKHAERLVAYQDDAGKWVKGDIEQAREQLQLLATAQTERVVRRGRQTRAKRQRIRAKTTGCPIRLTYETHVRREGPRETVQKKLWLVEVRLPDTQLKPWLLVTDWPVTDSDTAVRIFQMYRQRWAVEDSFRFVTDCFSPLLAVGGVMTESQGLCSVKIDTRSVLWYTVPRSGGSRANARDSLSGYHPAAQERDGAGHL